MSLLIALVLTSLVRTTQQGASAGTYDQIVARGLAAGREGRTDEAIAAFQKCLELRPKDSQAAYNLACFLSRKGEVDAALDWLGKSIGWADSAGFYRMLGDPDFEPLRSDPRYQSLLDRARQLREVVELPLPPVFIDWSGGHRHQASVAEFSPDGRKIISGGHDGWARIWDCASGELLLQFKVGGRLGLCKWAESGRTVLTGGTDDALRFWDARTGDLLRLLPGATFQYQGALSRDGRLIIGPSSQDSLRMFDLQSGRGLETDLGTQAYGADFSPDGTRFAACCADGTTRLFEVWSRECLASHQSGTAVFDLSFSPDGRWLVAAGADGMVRWLDARTLELLRSFRAHRAEVNGVAFSPDGAELLTTSVDRTAKVWSAADGSLRLTLSGHADEVLWGAYSADGGRILTPSRDGTVRVWDSRGGDLILTLSGLATLEHRTVAFSPEATLVSFDDRGAREWDAATGRELEASGRSNVVRLRGHGGLPRALPCQEVNPSKGLANVEIDGTGIGVDAVFLAPDRRAVYTADRDDRGRLWSAESGHLLRDLGPLSRDGVLTAESSRWSSARFSPDGVLLATAQLADGATRLWETSTGEELLVIRGGFRWSDAVAFDPTGERLAVTGGDGSVEIWDTFSRERLHSLKASNWPMSVAFRPDGQILATGNLSGNVQLWDLTRGGLLRTLRPLFTANVCSVAFSPDGKRVAAATVDHRVSLWDAEGGRLLGTIVPGDEPDDWLAFTPSAHYLGTPASIARARLVQGAISYPLSCFAAALEDPEKVRASFAGVEVELPKLPTPPSLVIAEPVERVAVVGERTLRVQAIATEGLAGIEHIDVVQDGASVPAEVLAKAVTLDNNERLARLDLRLPIPAGTDETKITLQAVSARGIKSRPESFVVRYEPPKHEIYVLALGVSDYADNSLDLAYPVQDVDGLVQRLQTQNGELFHAVHVERRVNREVTNAEVLRLREEFLLQAKPDDTLVVFVAGHGVRTDTGEYWFLTTDATPAKPFGGVQRSTLESLVTWDKLNATKRVLLLDTCHSGAAFGKGTRGERGIAFQQSEVDTLLERSSGLYILAATSDDGFAREQEGNGLFTRALLDGLDGAADAGDFGDKDGTVGIDELMHFARYAVLERSAGRQQPTFPRIEGGENFPLARVSGEGGARR